MVVHTPCRSLPGVALAVATLAAASPGSAAAQTIRGRLVDDATDGVIAGANLTLLTEDGDVLDRALSDSLGVFLLDAELGSLHIEAQRIGYRTTRSLLFDMNRLDTLDVEFRIDAEAVLLAPILVTATDPPGEDLFEERKALGEGFFYTPELLDSIRPDEYVAEIFRARDRRTWMRWSFGMKEDGSTGPMPSVITRLGRGCLKYVVDRIPVARPFFDGPRGRGVAPPTEWGVPPLSTLHPDDLVAVEVYRAPHELPPGFVDELRPRNGQEQEALREINRLECGVVVFWTEDGW
ncbi:MAG: carboxypeptidase-like regulatory domain-containing protein [Longimicrobiales bacterium]